MDHLFRKELILSLIVTERERSKTWTISHKKSQIKTNLRCTASIFVMNETGVGIIFDVFTFDVVLEMIERFIRSINHLYHTHLHDINLETIYNKLWTSIRNISYKYLKLRTISVASQEHTEEPRVTKFAITFICLKVINIT